MYDFESVYLAKKNKIEVKLKENLNWVRNI